MTLRRRTGIMGGTFDPIHSGHRDLALAAESAIELTELFLIPVSVPPHRPQPVVSSYHRFTMTALSAAGHPRWRACDLELRSTTPSYTSATLSKFRENGYAPSELFFIIGADAFAEIESWRDFPTILEHANFAVVSRPGWAVDALPPRLPFLSSRVTRSPHAISVGDRPRIILIDAPTADVSSTAIRARRAAGQSIAGMVDPRVEQHIEQHGLYSESGTDGCEQERSSDSAAGRLHG
jgi:nicotinate-nucleotide adenylyltransferase